MTSIQSLTPTFVALLATSSTNIPLATAKQKKRKVSWAFYDQMPPEDMPLVVSTPTYCTHRCVRTSPPCGEPLFEIIAINAKTYTIPLLKYEVQDLKQWVGHLLSRPTIEDLVFKAFQRPRKEYMEDMWDARHLCWILLKKDKHFLPGPTNEMLFLFNG